MFYRLLKKIFFIVLGLSISLFCHADSAQLHKKIAFKASVILTDGWLRATAEGQEVGAAYISLTSRKSSTLVTVKTDVADRVEMHSMSMDNGVMKMRHIEMLDLPENKTVRLAPGGFHLMLFDLKKPLKAGDHATFKLIFKAQNGRKFTQTLIMPILADAPTKIDGAN